MAHLRIQEGQYTQRIYGLIKEQNYGEVVQILNYELQSHPKSRAALSLLGFCYYRLQDFQAAADCYEQLVQLHPDVHDYQFYYAQCLYKACMFPEATKASCQLEHEEYQTKARAVFPYHHYLMFLFFAGAQIAGCYKVCRGRPTKCQDSSGAVSIR
jgi:tetratricopeptide repeat protein 30